MKYNIRGVLYIATNFITVLVTVPFINFISYISDSHTLGFRFVTIACRFYFGIFGLKMQIEGAHHNDKSKPCLMICNHQSYLDIPIVLMIRNIAFISKIEIKRWPLFGWGMQQNGCVFLDRTDNDSRKKVATDVLTSMKNGNSFCVFPEGTRSKTLKMASFHNGIFKIAKEIGVPILPITIHNSGELMPTKTLNLKAGTIKITIHPAVDIDQSASITEIRENIWGIVNSVLDSSKSS